MRTLLTSKKALFIVAVCGLGTFIFLIKVPRYYVDVQSHTDTRFGITFSKTYAEELGLDWKETYDALITDLKVDRVRIPVYWDDIEEVQSAIDLTDYRYMLEEARANDVSVILAVGKRLPRWPECHEPAWYEALSEQEREQALFTMLEIVVKSFTEFENISYWQIENEPLVAWFGECKEVPDPDLVKREIEFVRTFDDRPIIITDSGEWGTWKKSFSLGADRLGITTYRVVWNRLLGYVRLSFPPAYYTWRASLADIPKQSVFSIELQAEPWVPGHNALADLSISEQYTSMSPEQFQANINYAYALGFEEAYLWGAEWWYWLYKNGNDSIWNKARILWEY